MADEYDIEAIIPAPPGLEDKKYKMRRAKWVIDMNQERECMDANGDLNWKDFFIKRLLWAVQDMTEEKLRAMYRWEANGLIGRWMEHNNVDQGRFLATSSLAKKTDCSITTP